MNPLDICPFCDSSLVFRIEKSVIGDIAFCQGCGARVPYAIWNNRPREKYLRAEYDRLAARVAELEAALRDIDHGPVGYWNEPQYAQQVIQHFIEIAHKALTVTP